jgi:hypothetical protein
MKILFDECLPRKLKPDWSGHEIFTVPDMGWTGKSDDELAQLMSGQFDVFFTMDQNFQYSPTEAKGNLTVYILPHRHNTPANFKSLMSGIPQYLKRIEAGLYEMPIEDLSLSQTAINKVKRTGITTVGDCIDFFERIEQGVFGGIRPDDSFEALFDDVKPKLEAQGYWPLGKA